MDSTQRLARSAAESSIMKVEIEQDRLDRESDLEMPVDARPLVAAGESHTMEQASEDIGDDVLFIGEDTPAPDIAIRIVSSSGCHHTNSDDVLYIGDE